MQNYRSLLVPEGEDVVRMLVQTGRALGPGLLGLRAEGLGSRLSGPKLSYSLVR